MLQLQRRNDPIGRLALRVMRDHFDDLTHHTYSHIMQSLNIDKATFEQVEHVIRHLDPKPGTPYASSMQEQHGQQITPDFVVEQNGEQLTLSLYNNIPELQISQSYAQLLESYERKNP